MRKLIITLLLTVLCSAAFAQESNNGTLKFIGIPIDGPKEQLIEKIKAKGFRSSPYREGLLGQFNGQTVEVEVLDNHGTAYCVCVAFPGTSAYMVRTEYNALLEQFLCNDKYLPVKSYEKIPEDVDFSFGIAAFNEKYRPSFAYISPDIFTKDEAKKLREAYAKLMTMPEEERNSEESLLLAFASDVNGWTPEEASAFTNKLPTIRDGGVCFTIIPDSGEYQIGLFYYNLKNAPRGEDL